MKNILNKENNEFCTTRSEILKEAKYKQENRAQV